MVSTRTERPWWGQHTNFNRRTTREPLSLAGNFAVATYYSLWHVARHGGSHAARSVLESSTACYARVPHPGVTRLLAQIAVWCITPYPRTAGFSGRPGCTRAPSCAGRQRATAGI